MTNGPNSIFSDLGLYTLSQLSDEDKQPPVFIVDGLVPVGMTFISGAPKIRKSFLALGMAAAVARGEDFLGHPTKQCDVVYLDLEGSPFRISQRTRRMSSPLPDNVFITNNVKEKLAGGLIGKLRTLHQACPGIGLIIVDTFSRARGAPQTAGRNAYDVDVALLAPAQRMALEEKLALVFVHHDRKGAASVTDSFERLSGTMGISGSADSVINLTIDGQRFTGKAKMEFTPRDAKGGEENLIFNESTLQWEVDGNSKRSIQRDYIARWVIQNAPRIGTASIFCSYESVFEGAFGSRIDNPGNEVRQSLDSLKIPLYSQYGIAVQTGAKSHGIRGIRMLRT